MISTRPILSRPNLRAARYLVPALVALVLGFPAATAEPAVEPLPWKVNAEMEAWAREVVPTRGPVHRKLRALYQALTSPTELGLHQDATATLTAAETFRQRRGNCVSFSLLFAGLARRLEIPVYFVLAEEPLAGEARRDLRVVQLHLAVASGRGSGLRVYDFGGPALAPRRRWLPVSDLTAAALFTSNQGAEALIAGDPDTATTFFRRATVLDPHRPNLWTNLGVARRRTGDVAGAQRAYRQALDLDPASPVAAGNLSALLRNLGRPAEAEALLDRQPEDGANPLALLELAEGRLLAGDLERARKLYRRALELSE